MRVLLTPTQKGILGASFLAAILGFLVVTWLFLTGKR